MPDELEPKRFFVDCGNLPPLYPTQRHSAAFWEALGRTVATFGFLEEALLKAIFVFTATRRVPKDEFEQEYEKWLATMERALSDPLGPLIDSYGKAVRANDDATVDGLDELLAQLRKASPVRNALCHGSWRTPDDQGRSIPFFIDRKNGVFQTPIDVAYLQQLQRHAIELACDVMNTVTQMGWQFPGSSGPGKPVS